MHAANPALAIEQATTITLISSPQIMLLLAPRLTSHLRLTPALRSRYRAPALEQHAHRRGREQERHHALLRVIAHKLPPHPNQHRPPHVALAKCTSQRGEEKRTSTMYLSTAGMTPAAPFVGLVTIRPPLAFTSFTAIA